MTGAVDTLRRWPTVGRKGPPPMMPTAAVRRTGALLLVALVLVTASGCQTVRQGTKCKVGTAPGRDATHVLFCVNGKWKRALTIGQAAQILLAKKPVSITAISGVITATAGSTAPIELAALVKNGDGSAATDVNVTFSLPTSGAGGTLTGPSTVKTAADGVARVSFLPNTVAGSFSVSAAAENVVSPATFSGTVAAGPLATVSVVSGNNQTTPTDDVFGAPFVSKSTDRYGNPIAGLDLALDYDDSVIEPFAGNLRTDANGLSSIRVGTYDWAGSDYLLVGVQMPDGSVIAARFDFTITP